MSRETPLLRTRSLAVLSVYCLGTLVATPKNIAIAADSMVYRVEIENSWSPETHPGAFPEEAHFSWFGGATHSAATEFWRLGEVASPGMIEMAETGATFELEAEVDAAIGAGSANHFIKQRHWFCPEQISYPLCGPKTFELMMDADFPLVTLVSMLGPSPDWFVGVSGLNLRQDGHWRTEIFIDLHPYDGGTRSANQFELFGPTSEPPEPIRLITEESGELIGPQSLGSFRFIAARRLTIHVEEDTIFENGGTSQITITRDPIESTSVEVRIEASDSAVLNVPESVTIPADQGSIQLVARAIDIDQINNGSTTVCLTATAEAHALETDCLTVEDDDLSPILVERIDSKRIQLTWEFGTLQTAPTVSGPWTDPSVSSPLEIETVEDTKFFRLTR